MNEIVWFKRDLRVEDHAPLALAAARGPVFPLYVLEPDLAVQPDASAQHAAFARECLSELDGALRARGVRLRVVTGTMPGVLDALLANLGRVRLWSHEETGNGASFARDRRVRAWCRIVGVEWTELPGNGVVRGLRDRDGWSAEWDRRMSNPVVAAPGRITPALGCDPHEAPLQCSTLEVLSAGTDKGERQRGGRLCGVSLLESFLAGRGTHYRTAMSSPLSAEDECSRLSPHLAFGTISVRETAQALWTRRSMLQALDPSLRPGLLLASLRSFESRLHWHCHFIQKLESEPRIEYENLHRGYDGLREPGTSPGRLEAWRRGETGYPFVDACMRKLAATGWINFRMRAMLVSFASYQLWLHWREPALHLAREFLDYEPGIHYPQVQMQSGTTGINTVRIYNPVKQARDQDPRGDFVRRWIPELASVPADWLFEPWTMPPAVQMQFGVRIGVDYPGPVVDLETSTRAARDRMHAVRSQAAVREQALAVYVRHGSRNPAREGPARRRSSQRSAGPPRQFDLFNDEQNG
jgi:deoxyribodipyrimidine photo-lyase